MKKRSLLFLGILFVIMILLVSCTKSKPVETSNGAICDKIKENKILNESHGSDVCYEQIATFKKDPSFCKKISDPVRKDSCTLASMALSFSTDSSLCDTLTPGVDGKDPCYWNVAKLKQDPSFCNNIETSTYKEICFEEASLTKQDPSFCESKDEIYSKDYCYYNYAMAKRDISFCDKIINIDFKDNCHFKLDISKSDFGVCPESPTSSRNMCYFSAAMFFGDASRCELLPSLCQSVIDCWPSKEYCYFIIGGATNDVSICDSIDKDELLKEHCYTSIGLNNGDPAICDKIKDKDGKERCLKYVQPS